jgi:hypothetical protein
MYSFFITSNNTAVSFSKVVVLSLGSSLAILCLLSIRISSVASSSNNFGLSLSFFTLPFDTRFLISGCYSFEL